MIGKELGQYKILAEIGRGGMGIVYRAYQTSLNREVALKILPPQLSIDKDLVTRFHREAESAARLSHPNIVQIFDINEIDGIHFFAMEYLKGDTLTQKILNQGPLSIKEAVHVVALVADALSYSHAEGIIHRDIKPGNIMIDPHGHVKVTDFGLARVMESARLTLTGTIIGTPEYMSPEQAQGQNLDGRSDLYSLGIVLYEAITSKLPFEATTPFAMAQKQISAPLPSPRSIRPEIPEVLEQIIIKSTQKNPDERYQSVEKFKKDLDAFSSGISIERITPTVVVSPGAWPKKRIIRVAIPLIALACLIFAIKSKKPLPEIEPDEAPEQISEQAPEISEEKVSEQKAPDMLKDAKHLIDQGAYTDAIAKLEEFKEIFPDEPQAKLIPDWIKEIQNKAIRERFGQAQELADQGEIVEAILEFNQIARDYPETRWEAECNKKVEELKSLLKEREAEKNFLEAQELKRKNKFIEATQAYQNIITGYPETTWAEKSEEEIARLKETQEQFREKIREKVIEGPRKRIERPQMGPSLEESPRDSEEPPQGFKPRSIPPYREMREDIRPEDEFFEKFREKVSSNKTLKSYIKKSDVEGLHIYLMSKYYKEIKDMAKKLDRPFRDMAIELSERLVHEREPPPN